jgi:hypothetical protein
MSISQVTGLTWSRFQTSLCLRSAVAVEQLFILREIDLFRRFDDIHAVSLHRLSRVLFVQPAKTIGKHEKPTAARYQKAKAS